MFSNFSRDKPSSYWVIHNYRRISQDWYTWMTERSWTCDSHIGGGTLLVCLRMSLTLSFVAGRQVSRLGENGADGKRGGFLCAWVRRNVFSCTCAAKFFGPSSARTRWWGTASCPEWWVVPVHRKTPSTTGHFGGEWSLWGREAFQRSPLKAIDRASRRAGYPTT
jgi:hypothetical protein